MYSIRRSRQPSDDNQNRNSSSTNNEAEQL